MLRRKWLPNSNTPSQGSYNTKWNTQSLPYEKIKLFEAIKTKSYNPKTKNVWFLTFHNK